MIITTFIDLFIITYYRINRSYYYWNFYENLYRTKKFG